MSDIFLRVAEVEDRFYPSFGFGNQKILVVKTLTLLFRRNLFHCSQSQKRLDLLEE